MNDPPEGQQTKEGSGAGSMAGEQSDTANEVLIVVSKLKKYIRARSGMNTSDAVVPVLSDHLRKLCEEAIANATRDGRKTVMDRDFKVGGGS
jgi:histone H3/H4